MFQCHPIIKWGLLSGNRQTKFFPIQELIKKLDSDEEQVWISSFSTLQKICTESSKADLDEFANLFTKCLELLTNRSPRMR